MEKQDKIVILSNLIEENVFDEPAIQLSNRIGYKNNCFCPSEITKAIDRKWEKLIKLGLSEYILIQINEVIQKGNEFDALPVPQNDVILNKYQWRMELLRSYVANNFNARRKIIESKGLDKEIVFLNQQNRNTLIGLHALYSYKYWKSSKHILPPIVDFLYREVAKCYPIYYSTIENWKIFAKQNDINVNIFYNYFLQEILILSLIENTLKLFDTRVEDSLTFNYENFAKMLGVKINKVKDYFDETINIGKFFPDETLWGNSENEDIIGLIVQNSIFYIFVTCQLKNTGNINISYYFILIKEQNIVFIPINEIKFYTYKVLYQDLTNGEKIITKLQPLTPIPELDCEIMPIEGENVNSLLITEIEKLGDMIDEVSNLKVADFLVERQGIELFIYDKNKNITSKYILKKEEYQEIPELMELTDEDIPEIYLINGISVFWPRVHYKLSLSEFTLVNK